MSRNRVAYWRLRDGDMAMAVSPSWHVEPPRARVSRWRERLGWVAWLSLLLHVAVVALVFLAPAPPRPPISDETPPGEVALVFEGGSRTAPASPVPSQETALGPPSPETAPQAPPAGMLAPPEAPAAAPSPPPAMPAPPAAPVPPSEAALQPPAPAPQAAAPAAPPPLPLAMLPAPDDVPQAPPPPLPVPPQPVPPLPAPPRPLPVPPRAEPVRPTPRPAPPPPRPRVATPRPDAFPKPLNFAFGGSILDGRGTTGRAAPHESMGPVQPGPTSRSAFNSDIAGNIGPDYRNLLRAWLERHKYYPPQAVLEGEDGTASVRVVIRKDGFVRLVELEGRSGSTWLDMGAQALFRGQRLPAFPSDAMGDEQEVLVTIHYILIRG